VGRVAKDNLALRLEMLQALEASAIHTQVSMQLPVVTGSSPYAAPNGDGTQTQATIATSILPHGTEPRWRKRAPWLFAAGGVLTAVLVWAFTHSSSKPLVPAATAATSAFAAPSAPTAGPLTSISPKLEQEPPVVAADSMPLASAPAAVPPAAAPLSAAPKLPVKKPTPHVGTAVQSTATRAKSCNPPYRIDAAGVRRVKPECL
jgi:eukaryotic-like serine/threonine-protein kinase